MTLLTGVTDLANRVRDEIQSNLGRYQNKKFRDACMGVSALVAMADGILQDEERKKVIACIRNTEALSFFDATELRDIFLGFCNQAQDEFTRVEVIKAIAKVKSDPEIADRVVKIGIIIARSDRVFGAEEKAVLQEVIAELGLNESDYDLSGAVGTLAGSAPAAPPVPSASARQTIPEAVLPPYIAGNSLKVVQKGERISLVKLAPALADSLVIGIAFDKAGQGQTYTVSARLFDKDKRLLGRVDLSNRTAASGAIVHRGNVRSKSQLGDDEEFLLSLSGLAAAAASVVLVLEAVNAPSITELRGVTTRLLEEGCGRQILSSVHVLSSKPNVLVLGRLYLHNGEWKFQANGEEFVGRNAEALAGLIAALA